VSDLRPSAKKSGRPLAPQTIAIRNAILELPAEQKQMTVRGVLYALTVRDVVEKSEAGYRQVQRQVLLLRREAAKLGAEAVELDAIRPDKLKELIENAIASHIDWADWGKEQVVEQSEREILERMVAA
jgi:hypothetical protein